MITAERSARVLRHIADHLIQEGEGADHAERLAVFTRNNNLDLEDLATLTRFASGEAAEGDGGTK